MSDERRRLDLAAGRRLKRGSIRIDGVEKNEPGPLPVFGSFAVVRIWRAKRLGPEHSRQPQGIVRPIFRAVFGCGSFRP